MKILSALTTGVCSVLLLGLSSPAFAADEAANLYKTKCQMCHGADGKGATPAGKTMKAPDFTKITFDKPTTTNAINAILNGKGKMSKAKDVSPSQAQELVTFIQQKFK